MDEYQYRAIDFAGKEKKGRIDAQNKDIAMAKLKSEFNVILSLDPINILNRDIEFAIFQAKIKPREFSVFCRQFVTLIGAGVSVIKALEMLAVQTENKSLKKAVANIHKNVSKGEPLAAAMRKESKVFPGMFCNMVEAGEESGNLENSFERMAIQFEENAKLTGAVKKAMIYPMMLLIVMIGVVIAMMIFVVPSFLGMFETMGTELPFMTQAIVDASDFLVAKWWLLLIIVIGIFVAFRFYSNTPMGRDLVDGLKLKIPVFGKLVMKSSCAKMARTLSTLLGAGVPMIEALEITARSLDNVRYKAALIECKNQVGRGVPLSRPLKTSGLFPPMVLHMIAIGEETGKIENMLENMAKYYEEDVQVSTEQMMALMEPMIIVVMAVVVFVIVIGVMSPMMGMYENIEKM